MSEGDTSLPGWAVLKLSAISLAIVLAAVGCTDNDLGVDPNVEVVVEGLVNPIGITVLEDGSLLVAEAGSGEDDHSGGVSLVSAGRVDRVVTGLPSGRDSGDLSGPSLVGVSPDGATVYTAHFGAGGLLTFPTPSADTVAAGAVIDEAALQRDMTAENRVQLVNPFDIAFDVDGVPVVTDATENGVATRTPEGTTRFIHRFGELVSPESPSLRVEAVPTGIAAVGREFYVTLTGGCPFPPGVGRVVAIGEDEERTVATGLDMPIDVAVDEAGTVWVLQFARFEPGASCFTGEGYQPETGRLVRLDDGDVEVVLDDLDFPGAMAFSPDGSLYITEVFGGRVLRVGREAADDAVGDAASPWQFREVANERGIDFVHGAFSRGLSDDHQAMMGGGLCWLDVDGDGWLDLYLVNGHSLDEEQYWEERGGLPTNKLYRNTGDGFTDVSAGSGADLAHRGMGCVAADFDGDGHTDIFVTADGPDSLLINDGTGRFQDTAIEAGVAGEGWTTAAVVSDVEGDGDLDLFVGSYIDLARTIENPSGAFPQDYLGLRNHLYLNDGTGGFDTAGADVGLVEEDRTLGAVFTDANGDGVPDLYVANDGQPNRLYVNRSEGQPRFVDVTRDAAVGDPGSGMGVASGDYDGDGAGDLFVTNWDDELHTLYRNDSSDDMPSFAETTLRVGIAGFGTGDTGWGTTWGDFDHDTDLDLVIANGRVPITDMGADAELVRLIGNLLAEGRPGEMRDWTARVGLDEVGPLLGRGSAVADFDNDGDLDIAINQIAGPAVLLENDGALPGWIGVELEPATPGTTVTVTLDDGRTLVRELRAGGSYLASEDPRAHFGLGHTATSVTVEVRWPDGGQQRLEDVPEGEWVTVTPP